MDYMLSLDRSTSDGLSGLWESAALHFRRFMSRKTRKAKKKACGTVQKCWFGRVSLQSVKNKKIHFKAKLKWYLILEMDLKTKERTYIPLRLKIKNVEMNHVKNTQ